MKAEGLRNFSGGKHFAWPSSDPLHLELPNAKLPDNHAKVVQCLQVYAKATRHDGKAKNVAFETTKGHPFQRKWLQDYDAALAKAKKGKGPGPGKGP